MCCSIWWLDTKVNNVNTKPLNEINLLAVGEADGSTTIITFNLRTFSYQAPNLYNMHFGVCMLECHVCELYAGCCSIVDLEFTLVGDVYFHHH